MRCLDLGGVGRYREWLPRGRHVTLDLNRGHRPDVQGTGQHLPFRDGSFDLILSTEVLEHCPEPAVVASEARRVLEPGGTLVLTTPFVYVVHGWPDDYFRYTASGLRHLFRDFSAVDIISFGNRFVVAYDLMVGFAPVLSSFANTLLEPLVRETRSDLCPAGHVLVATR